MTKRKTLLLASWGFGVVEATVLTAVMLLWSFSSVAQVWIQEQQQAEFPLTLIPQGNKKIILAPNGQIDPKSTAEVVGGFAVSGHYLVSSDSSSTITVDVISNEDDSQISLKSFSIIYKGVTYSTLPVSGLPSPGNGEDLYVGFTAILKPSAGEGERYPSYTIDIVED